MARGLQKLESQQKNAAKANAGGKSNLKTRAAAFKISCPSCKLPLSDYTNFKAHFESKHPKLPLPTEESLAPK
ncbi:hypothetical protein Rhopal_002357-T1 [Rhodotorula paludigena]|uniref:Uncharacterized protein n=1 Tax=Rhodotorula paludigena TaxID=86838 RepID=A0AAV5GK07_9BASI|nr:hypothetical protein Rhopal_002357-T1 [Rhodotorula paludigena]